MDELRIDIVHAVDHFQKMRIFYINERGEQGFRTICPTTLYTGKQGLVIGAWCEKADGFRTFKLPMIKHHKILRNHFTLETVEA